MFFSGAAMSEQKKINSIIDDNGLMGQDMFNIIAIAYKDMELYEKSTHTLEIGLKYYDSYQMNYNLAQLYLDNNQSDKAKESLLRAKKIRDMSGDMEFEKDKITITFPEKSNRQNITQKLSKNEITEVQGILKKLFSELYVICDDCERYSFLAGNIWYNSGDYYEAVVSFDREMIMNPNDLDFMKSFSREIRSLALDKLGEKDEICYYKQIHGANQIEDKLNQVRELKDKNKIIKAIIDTSILTSYHINYFKYGLERPTETSNHECFKIRDINKKLSCIEKNSISDLLELIKSDDQFKVPKSIENISELLENDGIGNIDNNTKLFVDFVDSFVKFNIPYIEGCKKEHSIDPG